MSGLGLILILAQGISVGLQAGLSVSGLLFEDPYVDPEQAGSDLVAFVATLVSASLIEEKR